MLRGVMPGDKGYLKGDIVRHIDGIFASKKALSYFYENKVDMNLVPLKYKLTAMSPYSIPFWVIFMLAK